MMEWGQGRDHHGHVVLAGRSACGDDVLGSGEATGTPCEKCLEEIWTILETVPGLDA